MQFARSTPLALAQSEGGASTAFVAPSGGAKAKSPASGAPSREGFLAKTSHSFPSRFSDHPAATPVAASTYIVPVPPPTSETSTSVTCTPRTVRLAPARPPAKILPVSATKNDAQPQTSGACTAWASASGVASASV
jgi:hypothetical protein